MTNAKATAITITASNNVFALFMLFIKSSPYSFIYYIYYFI
jgi:hypothetical protein